MEGNTRVFAARLEEISASKAKADVQTAYLLALSRKPTSEELTIAESHLQHQEELYLEFNTALTLTGKALETPVPSSIAKRYVD